MYEFIAISELQAMHFLLVKIRNQHKVHCFQKKNNSCIKSCQRNKEMMDITINETMKPKLVQCFSLFLKF